MAERRMFAKTIVLSDAFLDMPLSTRCLYFSFGMVADDDGFINNPKSILRMCGASKEDMDILITEKYIIPFKSGVIAIRAWRANNYLQKDRCNPTSCKEEMKTLSVSDSGFYVELTCGSESEEHPDYYVESTCGSGVYTQKSEKEDSVYTQKSENDISVYTQKSENDDSVYTQDRLDKISIDQDNKRQNAPTGAGARTREGEKRTIFPQPTLDEIREYCQSRNNNIDPEQFYDFYESKGWMIGKNRMKDWKAAVRTWERSREHASPDAPKSQGSFDTDDFFQAALSRSYRTEGT
jgi:hypothetical protein